MRALISLIAGGMLLNLSAHAVSAAKNHEKDDGIKFLDEDVDLNDEEDFFEEPRSEMPRDYITEIKLN
jgi:hypothetical protein